LLNKKTVLLLLLLPPPPPHTHKPPHPLHTALMASYTDQQRLLWEQLSGLVTHNRCCC
jgi:hypothetical protein